MLAPYVLIDDSDRTTTASTTVGLVCHMVIDVEVTTAKRCPARATRRARMGSLGEYVGGAAPGVFPKCSPS